MNHRTWRRLQLTSQPLDNTQPFCRLGNTRAFGGALATISPALAHWSNTDRRWKHWRLTGSFGEGERAAASPIHQAFPTSKERTWHYLRAEMAFNCLYYFYLPPSVFIYHLFHDFFSSQSSGAEALVNPYTWWSFCSRSIFDRKKNNLHWHSS